MSDLLRMTGMYSGMDTEAIIQSLVSTKRQKVTTLKNDQKKLEWKQNIWQDLNSKLYGLYSKTLSNLRFSSAFAKKKTKVSDPTKATIIASDGAVNGSQTLKVNQLAKSGYLTGAAISKVTTGPVKSNWDKNTKLSDMNPDLVGSKLEIKTEHSDGTSATTQIQVTANMTIQDFMDKVKTDTGVEMRFDEDAQKMTVAPGSGNTSVELAGTSDSKASILQSFGLADYSREPITTPVTGEEMKTTGKIYGAANNWNGTQTRLSDINKELVGETLSFKLSNGKTADIAITKTTTLSDIIKEAKKIGVDMEFDANSQQLTVNSGSESLELSTKGGSTSILQALGLDKYSDGAQKGEVVGNVIKLENPDKNADGFKNDSYVKDIDNDLIGKKITLTVGKGLNAKTTQIEITGDMKISDLTRQLREGGVNASFDETNQRLFISSTGTGTEKGFSITGNDEALKSLGIYVDPSAKPNEDGIISTDYHGSQTTMIVAQDAEIELNGAKFTSSSNTFNVNGLAITANAKTNADEPVTITTETDYDGIYEMMKDFITEYNEIMNEMNKLYGADSARKYDMLSDEQKESMSEEEVEKWEDTIKGSLLRRDSTLYSIMNSMKEAVNGKYTVNGKEMYLKDLGIGTLSYFQSTKENRYSLHIDGDPDDEATATEKDRLKEALAADPEQVIGLFTQMAKKMYDSLHESMGSTEYSSIYKVYEDKRMKIDYDSYTQKIKDAEKELSDYEDKWYKKFSAMEVALSKLQSNQSTISSMLGM